MQVGLGVKICRKILRKTMFLLLNLYYNLQFLGYETVIIYILIYTCMHAFFCWVSGAGSALVGQRWRPVRRSLDVLVVWLFGETGFAGDRPDWSSGDTDTGTDWFLTGCWLDGC